MSDNVPFLRNHGSVLMRPACCQEETEAVRGGKEKAPAGGEELAGTFVNSLNTARLIGAIVFWLTANIVCSRFLCHTRNVFRSVASKALGAGEVARPLALLLLAHCLPLFHSDFDRCRPPGSGMRIQMPGDCGKDGEPCNRN
jgi:hypothetical protein